MYRQIRAHKGKYYTFSYKKMLYKKMTISLKLKYNEHIKNIYMTY